MTPDVSPSLTLKRHVLVAEDDADMRALVSDCLRREGYHVRELPSATELLIWIAMTASPQGPASLPDLIVSDIRMPAMSGLQMLRGIRAAGWVTPVILMTAFGDAATREAAESLGAVLLDKPLQLAELRAHAHRLLAPAASAVEASPS